MTVTAQTPRIKVAANGSTTAFAFNFLIPSASDGSALCNVYVLNTTVAPSTLTLLSSSVYSVSGLDNPSGGSVTYPLSGTPLATGKYVIIVRTVPYDQPTAVSNQGFYPHTVETSEDWIVEQIQQLLDTVGRAFKVSLGDTSPSDLTPAQNREGYIADFNATTGDLEPSIITTAQLLAWISGAALDGQKITTVADADYTILAADQIVEMTSQTANRVITVPLSLGSATIARPVKIVKANTSVYQISIKDSLGNVVDVIQEAATSDGQIGGWRDVYSNGTKLRTMGVG